jgi:putative Holliday junction resolvase
MPDSRDYKTLLGFDFGLKQIGVACGQTLTNTSKGLSIIRATNGIPDWDQITLIHDQWKPDLLVVGLPLNMDDSESELSQLARKFARRLKERFKIDVIMMDERLTSREIKNSLREQSTHSKRKHKAIDTSKIDHLAAALILQNWLDSPNLGVEIS